jgi:eukaryotic-like serine/threonine-protein kinase
MQGTHASVYGTLGEAFNYFQSAGTTAQHLLKTEPDAPRAQRDLSVCYDRIGDAPRDQGDLPSALTSYKKSLEIAEKLAAGDLANTEWQRKLSEATLRSAT